MRRTRTNLTVVASLLVFGWSLLLNGCGTQSGAVEFSSGSEMLGTTDELPTDLVELSSKKIDFGIVPQSGHRREYFELRNTSKDVVELDRIETSCDCLAITMIKSVVPSTGKALACAVLDLSHAPEFVGPLGIQAKAVTATGEVAFLLTIDVDVRELVEFDGIETSARIAPSQSLTPKPMPLPENESSGR